MASSGKKKTTMAKLTRESRLRERRLDKQARKNARKYAAAHPGEASETFTDELGDTFTNDTDPSAPTGQGDPPAPGETEPVAPESVAQAVDA